MKSFGFKKFRILGLFRVSSFGFRVLLPVRNLSKKQRFYLMVGVVAFLLVMIPAVIYTLTNIKSAEAAWWNDSWGYRQTVSVTSGTALTDFQIAITLDTATLITAGKMRSDCNDLRITDINGELLPYWIEEGSAPCNNASTKIWTKVPSIYITGNTLLVYYGNPSAGSVVNGNKVFDFFDDFNSSSLDSKWSSTGAYSISGGKITITTGSVYTKSPVTSGSQNYMYEYRNKWTTASGSYSGLQIANAQATAGSNSTSKALVYFMTQSGGAPLTPQSWAANGSTASYNINTGSTQYTATQDTYYVDGFSIDPTNINFYNNRIQTNPYTGTWSATPYLWLGYFMGANSGTADIKDMTTDWVLVRKYDSSVVVGSPSNEEKARGPVGYWKFDEGYGTNTSDSTSNKVNGTITGATWQSEDQCINGKCLYFGGAGTVTMSTNKFLFASGDFSISVWVKPTALNGYDGIVTTDAPGQDLAWKIVRDSGNSNFVARYAGSSVSFGNATLNQWAQYSFTKSGTTITTYVNGKQINTGTVPATHSGTYAYLGLGTYRANEASHYFDGFIDEVKIYSYTRTSDQIKTDYSSRGSVAGVSTQIANDLVRQGSLASGLVGYWKMDEATWSGTLADVVDSSGNGNTGTAQGVTGGKAYPTTGKFGNGGYFDGTDNYVTFPTASIPTLTSFTASAWVYITGDGTEGINGIMNGKAFRFFINNDGRLRSQIGGATPYSDTIANTVTRNQWNHVLFTYDGSYRRYYINGSLVASIATTGTPSNSNDGEIGSIQATAYAFNGKVDEARIYNRALSPAEVSALYSWAPGPIAYYNFEEGSGSTVNDKSASSSANTGTWNGTGSHWTTGKYGKGGKFNGSNDYVSANTAIGNFGTSDFTVGTWIKFPLAGSSVWNGIISKGYTTSAPKNAWGIITGNPATGLYYQDTIDAGGSWNANYSFVNLPSSGWHYVSVTRVNGTSYKFYLDGVQNGTQTTAQTATLWNTSALQFGNADNRFLNSSIDDVRIYNYARTPGQIVEDMNAGHPIGGSPVASQVGYWKFDEGYGSYANNSGSQGLALRGTITGATWNNNGKFNKAVTFSDTGYMTIGSAANNALDIGTDYNKTFSFWFKTSNAAWSYIYYKKNPSLGTNAGIQINTQVSGSNMYLQVYIGDGTNNVVPTTPTSINLADNSWHHATVVLNSTTAQIYIDGKASGSSYSLSTLTGNPANALQAIISRNGGGFQGILDEFKVYNSALTADQIKLDYNQGKSMVLGSFGTDSDGKTASNSASRVYCVPGDTSTCNPPVAEWNFEEKQGVTANDSSGNGNTCALTNSPRWVSGKVGAAIQYANPTNNYLDCGNNSLLTVGINDFTISTWLYPTLWETDKEYSYIYRAKDGSNDNGYEFELSTWGESSNTYRIQAYRLQTTSPGYVFLGSSAVKIPKNTWSRVTIVRQGTSLTWYVNGIKSDTDTVSETGTNFNSTSNFMIGKTTWGSSQQYQGKIDQVRIFNYARTPAQIAWDYNQGKPVGHWKFDECQGGTAHNSSGNKYNGTITIGSLGSQASLGTCAASAATAWYNGATGKYNSSLNFDGVDDYVDFGDITELNNVSQFTISAWVKHDDNTNTDRLFHKIYDGNNDIMVSEYRSGTPRIYFEVGNGQNSYGYWDSSSISSGQWHHVTVVFDGSGSTPADKAKLFVNGVMRTLTFSGTLPTTTSSSLSGISFQLANMYSSGNNFQGAVDDLRIYNYALTEYQVRNVMNQGAAVRYGPATGSP